MEQRKNESEKGSRQTGLERTKQDAIIFQRWLSQIILTCHCSIISVICSIHGRRLLSMHLTVLLKTKASMIISIMYGIMATKLKGTTMHYSLVALWASFHADLPTKP